MHGAFPLRQAKRVGFAKARNTILTLLASRLIRTSAVRCVCFGIEISKKVLGFGRALRINWILKFSSTSPRSSTTRPVRTPPGSDFYDRRRGIRPNGDGRGLVG